MSDFMNRVSNVLNEHLGVELEKIKPDSRIGIDLGADSLDAVEVIMALEEEFEIDIPDDEMSAIAMQNTTVQQLVALVEKKTGFL